MVAVCRDKSLVSIRPIVHLHCPNHHPNIWVTKFMESLSFAKFFSLWSCELFYVASLCLKVFCKGILFCVVEFLRTLTMTYFQVSCLLFIPFSFLSCCSPFLWLLCNFFCFGLILQKRIEGEFPSCLHQQVLHVYAEVLWSFCNL